MKFISKQTNYRVVLKQGQSAEPMTGRAAVPGVYIKFENGKADIQNEEYCKMMMNHPAFNRDFILANEEEIKTTKDPWEENRREQEPEHNVTNIEYGHMGKSLNPKPKISLSRDKQKELKKIATDMAKEMAPKMAKDMLREMAVKFKEEKEKEQKSQKQDKTSKQEKSKGGRPKGSSNKKQTKKEETVKTTDTE